MSGAKAGSKVKLQKLSAIDPSGTQGVVESYDEKSGKWSVKLPNGTVKKLKPALLVVQEESGGYGGITGGYYKIDISTYGGIDISGPAPPPEDEMAKKGPASSADMFRRSHSQSLMGPGGENEMARKGSASLLDGGGIKITYASGWPAPCIHYRKDADKAWTDPPGIPLVNTGKDLWTLEISAMSMEFVVNDGKSSYDQPPGRGNYKIDAPGKYMLRSGAVKRMVPPPRPPALVVVTSIEPTKVDLSWNPPDVEEGVSGYVVYQGGKDLVLRTNADTRTCSVEGLKGAVTYTFSVATLNSDGLESGRTSTEGTTSVPGKPSAPTFLQAVSRGPDHVALSWAPPLSIGGASVTAYHVFRNGVALDTVLARDPKTGEDIKDLGWRDTNVEEGKEYRYSVSAMHLPERTPSKACLVELLEKRASRSLMQVPEDENEGPPCDEIVVKAVMQIQIPRLGERKTHVILQGFNWKSCENKTGWYKVLMSKLDDLKRAGFDMMWLPPPAQAVDKAGYLPSKWYDLTSNYGAHQELVTLGKALCNQNIALMMDLVINHRCASKKDNRGRWTVFEQPEWGAWAICGNDNSGTGEGAQSTGELLEYAPDIDHTNPKVQEDTKAWMKWIFKEVGFCCLRLDFVIGYAAHFQEQYIRSVDSPFAVSEYWHGDPNVLRNYINKCKGCVAVFDFPIYYTLKHAVRTNDFGGLRWDGKAPGIMGSDPVRSCTFIENHDTDHLEVVGGCFGDNNQITRGYAYILTHPGTPTVYWTDWSDRGKEVEKKIEELVQRRKEAGIHCQSRLSIDCAQWGLYGAYIEGNSGRLALKLGTSDWAPQGGNWKVATYGHEYCVWICK